MAIDLDFSSKPWLSFDDIINAKDKELRGRKRKKILSVDDLEYTIGMILIFNRGRSLSLLTLRKMIAESLGLNTRNIILADMKSALEQLQSKNLIEKTKNNSCTTKSMLGHFLPTSWSAILKNV